MVDEAGGVVEVVVARVRALSMELQLVRRAAVHHRAVAQLVLCHPRHDHRRARLVAHRDVHLLRSIVPRRHAEDVGVERHIDGGLQLPPVLARHPGVGARRRGGQEHGEHHEAG
uniref:Uncharacterized protein n=1 Tax=Arundo donax TaxID=35708 RepID=A0A0A9EYF3_ARUDO